MSEPANDTATSIEIEDLEVEVAPDKTPAVTQTYPAHEYEFIAWLWSLFG
jgi:hypothetical protein